MPYLKTNGLQQGCILQQALWLQLFFMATGFGLSQRLLLLFIIYYVVYKVAGQN